MLHRESACKLHNKEVMKTHVYLLFYNKQKWYILPHEKSSTLAQGVQRRAEQEPTKYLK